MDNNEDIILEQLECPICTDYMTIPIKQCKTGHSVCEKCTQRLDRCVLCRSQFTETRNYTLEALAVKVKYPCANKDAGCTITLFYSDRDAHERMCHVQTFRVQCQMKGCSFVGDQAALKYHWKEKRTSCNIYGAANRCFAKLKFESYFVNLVEAFNELFWFKALMSNDRLCFAMQLIGKSENAKKFLYQIKISNKLLPQKKMILIDYCKNISSSDSELFTENKSIVVYYSTLAQYVDLSDANATLHYDMKVFRTNDQKRPNNRYQNPRDNSQINRPNSLLANHQNSSTQRVLIPTQNRDNEDCGIRNPRDNSQINRHNSSLTNHQNYSSQRMLIPTEDEDNQDCCIIL